MRGGRPASLLWVSSGMVLMKWADHDGGGHFACMECPEEMIGDMREFFGEWYDA
jgi:hypothetical protein